MNRFVAIFLILSLVAQCFGKLGIITYYRINKAYIAAAFCINKSRPAMECNGKCYLARQLRQQTEQERQIPANLKEISETVLFCNQGSMPAIVPALSVTVHAHFNPVYLPAHRSTIFHPPPVV